MLARQKKSSGQQVAFARSNCSAVIGTLVAYCAEGVGWKWDQMAELIGLLKIQSNTSRMKGGRVPQLNQKIFWGAKHVFVCTLPNSLSWANRYNLKQVYQWFSFWMLIWQKSRWRAFPKKWQMGAWVNMCSICACMHRLEYLLASVDMLGKTGKREMGSLQIYGGEKLLRIPAPFPHKAPFYRSHTIRL